MKVVKSLLTLLLLVMLFLPANVEAKDNKVNMYLFYSKSCPHCQALEEALVDIKADYPNLKLYKYEVSESVKNNKLMEKVATELNASAGYVPFTVIGTRVFEGYSGTQTKSEIEYALELYSSVNSYKDPIGKLLEIDYSRGTLTYEGVKASYEKSDQEDTTEEKIIDVPFIGPVATKTLSLPLISILIGTVDGFNPCAMWVLLFLLSVLIGMKDRKRMWILGSTFIVSSALIYLFFMLVWLNLNVFINTAWWKMIIAAVAFVGGYINLRSFFKSREDGCEVVDESKRKITFSRIKQFTSEKSFPLALMGIIALAVSFNFI
jgi:thiol-disulfide isomerase/thioredoxin